MTAPQPLEAVMESEIAVHDDLVYLTARQLLAGYRDGSLSPVEVMRAHLDRIEATEHAVNATTQLFADSALAGARRAAQRYRDGTARPLEGLPVATKDEEPIEGEPARDGCVLLVDEVGALTHPVITRIRDAGGIVHARTTTPEFCAAGFTHSELWGVSRNPWHTGHSPGGSSGGSGAALAAGQTPLATGNDIGGSIRMPASASGVVGFKPPYGRVPGVSPWNYDTYHGDGPLARTVDDCALLQSVIAGQHPDDPVSLPHPPDIDVSVRLGRVAFCVQVGDFPVAPEVEQVLREAAAHLAAQGVVVEEVTLPWLVDDIMATALAHYGHGFGAWLDTVPPEHRAALMPYTRQFLELSLSAARQTSPVEAATREHEVYRDLARIFAEHDALITPTLGLPAFEAGRDYVDDKLVLQGRTCETHFEAALTVPFNLTNRCPVLVVPVGRSPLGVPIGAQIVTRPYDDPTAFAVGRLLETIHPWYAARAWRPSFAGDGT